MKCIKNKWIQNILVVIIAFCISIALVADVKSTGNLSMAINGTGVLQTVVFTSVCIAIFRIKNTINKYFITKRMQVFYILVSFLLSAFMIIGKKQDAHEDLKYGYIAVLMFIGYFALFWCIEVLFDNKVLKHLKNYHTKPEGKISTWIFEKHSFVAPLIIVWLFRIPWMIAFFPCTVSWDGAIQIRNFYGREIFTNHHPPLVSFLYGNIAWYSNKLGIDNIGMFMIPVLQVLLSSFAVAKACELFKRLKVPFAARWCSLLYYAAFSVWCIYDCTIIKDTLYYPLVMLFTIKLIECLIDEDYFWHRKINLFLLIIYGIIMTQIRNNGIFVLVISLLILVCAVKKDKKKIIVSGMIIALLCIGILENIVYPTFGVINLEDKVDKYCLLFQQTAKYSIEHSDDITEEEREVLDQLFDYEELAKVYNPHLADWVKNCLRIQEGSAEDPTNSIFAGLRNQYLKVWFAQFCRHPLTYIDTFFECSYGYYYPDSRVYKEGYGEYELSHDLLTNRMSDISQIEKLDKVRFMFEQISKIEYLPGIGMLYRCGTYTWALIIIMLFLWKDRKYRALIGCVPAFVNVLICLISPVNTCIRYMMPTMCLIPILICLGWNEYTKGYKNDSYEEII